MLVFIVFKSGMKDYEPTEDLVQNSALVPVEVVGSAERGKVVLTSSPTIAQVSKKYETLSLKIGIINYLSFASGVDSV
jgi:hypothetical protein